MLHDHRLQRRRGRQQRNLSPKAKWGLGLGALAGTLAIIFWPKKSNAAPLPQPGPMPGPAPGPGPGPMPGPVTPGGGGGGGGAAPPYNYGEAHKAVEHAEAQKVYAEWLAGKITVPAGKDEIDYLADLAYKKAYPGGPFPIGGTSGGWAPWAAAWNRISAIITALGGG